MKAMVIFTLLSVICLGCERSSFDVNNPDVEEFVKQLKNGTYNEFEQTEDGVRLWAKMPSFSREDVPALISLSKDTELVTPCDHFPVNPLSSMWPYRVVDGKECIMLGEYLLWCAEAVLEGKEYASLNPVLVDINDSPVVRLSGMVILSVREMYQDWWDQNGSLDDPATHPLDGTGFEWR
mgnify:CR=1 FL=1|jgi:hypothetical protein